MKYDAELYLNSGVYSGDDDEIECHKEKIVTCRKPHECMGGCNTTIQPGERALYESGFMDGKSVSCYTCLPCIEAWLEKSGQVGFDEDGEETEA